MVDWVFFWKWGSRLEEAIKSSKAFNTSKMINSCPSLNKYKKKVLFEFFFSFFHTCFFLVALSHLIWMGTTHAIALNLEKFLVLDNVQNWLLSSKKNKKEKNSRTFVGFTFDLLKGSLSFNAISLFLQWIFCLFHYKHFVYFQCHFIFMIFFSPHDPLQFYVQHFNWRQWFWDSSQIKVNDNSRYRPNNFHVEHLTITISFNNRKKIQWMRWRL